MLERFRIGTRLAMGFGTVIAGATVAFLACAVIGLRGQDAIERADAAASERIGLVSQMRESQLALASAIRSAGLQTDGAMINRDVDVYRAALKSLGEAEARFTSLPIGDAERELLEKAAGLRKKAEPVVDEAIRFAMAFAGDEAAKALSGRFAPIEREWSQQFSDLAKLQLTQVTAAKATIASENRQRLLALGALLLATTLGGAAFGFTITRSVTRPLRLAAQVAARVAEGDLAVEIDATGNDEAADLLRSLRSMAAQLSTMVSAVRSSVDSIDVASREISQGNMDLSARTESQASAVQETAASLEQLTGMVNQNASNAESVRKLADRTAQVATQGDQAMTSVSATMSRISDSSRRIADIIGTIDGIAFQTNILALNAAVEAARAGEQGRGFAVVASEVRALAQRVTAAAAEVRGLIAESVERVGDGSRQVDSLGVTLKDLQGSVEKVRQLVAEITAASTHQSESIVQVNQAVHAIDSTTQQNSALVEEVAAAAQSLSGQTDALMGQVRRFRVAA